MAKVKIKNIDIATKVFIKSFNKNLKKNIAKVQKDIIIDEINSTILSGQSPVLGKKFKQYSVNYANRFKGGFRKPVNMILTGGMLNSLKVTQPRNKSGFLIEFKSKIAAIHNSLGAGKSKVIRRLLPNVSKGEKFKKNIRKVIMKIMKEAVKRTAR